MSRADTRILVLSCAWPPFREMPRLWWPAFRLHWPSCPWPVTWAECPDREMPWGDFAAEAAAGVAEAATVLWMDDFVLTGPVDEPEVLRCRAEMEERGAVYHRLQPTPECTDPFPHGRSGVHRPGVPYRRSLHVSIFRTEYLARSAAGVKDPWTYELDCNADPDKLFLAVARSNRPISHVEALKKRWWTNEGEGLAAAAGIPLGTRPA